MIIATNMFQTFHRCFSESTKPQRILRFFPMSRSLAQFHSGCLDEWNLLDSRESWVVLGSWASDAPVCDKQLSGKACVLLPKSFFYPWEFIWHMDIKQQIFFWERVACIAVFVLPWFQNSRQIIGMDPVPHGATHRRIHMTSMTKRSHHFPCWGIWLPKDAWLQLFPCWWKSNSLHGLGMPIGHPGYRSPSQDVNFHEHRSWWTLMKIPFQSNCQSPSWTFRIQIWAVRWQNTTSCRFQPHQACSSAISAMESLSSYETLVVLPKGSEVDDETARHVILGRSFQMYAGVWFQVG